MALKTDYKNDVLDTSKNTEKQFRLTQLSGNNYTIEDITAYSQEGDTFNASDINATNTEVNKLTSQLSGYSIKIVSSKPTSFDANTIYLVKL